MADPTPALPSGTADMIEPVSDGVDSAMPADMVSIGISRMTYGVPEVTNENMQQTEGRQAHAERDRAVQPDVRRDAAGLAGRSS